MTQEIKNVIEKIKSTYDVDISSIEEQEDGTVYLTIKDKLYTIYPAQKDQYYTDIVYYIAADADLYTETEECTNVSDMGVMLISEAIKEDKIYKYQFNPDHIDYSDPTHDVEKELEEISKYEPFCKVTGIDNELGMASVDFDIPENEDKNLPYTGEYTAYFDELIEVQEEQITESVDTEDPRKQAGPYRYITKHGIGPGTLPKDVKLVKWEDLDNYRTAIWTDRFLTTQELEDYDIYPESVQENLDVEEKTDDQELTEIINSNPSLLVALDSEKDAKITYSTLIEIEESSENPDQEIIALLKKILADELEHIALLSAQQAKQTSQFVAEDSQGEFESVIDDIKEE